MNLTKRAKEDFKKWYYNIKEQDSFVPKTVESFCLYDNSMQWGVFVDFFDSEGLNILETCEFDYGYEILDKRCDIVESVCKCYETRGEARKEAIEKANIIYNNRYEQ